uniref:Neural cell adhesion molecule L1.1-like n=1 Tax=Gouania willdenowi TaxID=441366 RepID=A0A8C5HJB4_GOUWI
CVCVCVCVCPVSQPPVLTSVPSSFTAFSPMDMKLPCEASGNPTPTFRWVKDGQELDSEFVGSGTLTADVNKPLEWYAGFYRCYASNALGTAMTERVHVIVEPQPVLLKKQIVHKEAHEGESIVLSCNPPKSSTPPHIHWMDTRMFHIKQSSRVTTGVDGNLYFANVVKSDSRDDYTCHAQYMAASTILAEAPVNLTVLPSNNVVHGKKPHFFHPSGSHSAVSALRGQTVTLECIPRGLRTAQVMSWGGEVENYDRWLTFISITPNDDGEYECRASNSHGSTSHSFTVTVEAAPYWVKEPQNLQYAPGETVRLDCPADGIPTPTVSWSINGEPLSEVDEEPRRTVSNQVLILQDVRFSDTAVYQCQASNVHGSALANVFLFVVELPPQILSSDGVVYEVSEGGNVQMFCQSFGSPRPHIDAAPLLSDPRVSLLTDGTLELSNVSRSDSGIYTCSVTNSNLSITANLEVFERTTILQRPLEVRVRRGSSAMLDCSASTDPRLRDYQVVWRKDGHKIQDYTPKDRYTFFKNNTLKVSDVQVEDTAQYSCDVITRLDHTKATGSITVIAPPEPPSLLSLSNVEDWSLTLSWEPGPTHNSPTTEFIVEAREQQHGQEGEEEGRWKWAEFWRVPGDFDHTQLALHPYCSYRFRVIAVNQVGRSHPSDASDLHRTPPAVPKINPSGVRSNSTEPGTLIITWDELDKRSHNGPGFEYKVLYREADSPTTEWNVGSAKSPPFMVNNTGTYTPFEVMVQAVNAIGQGPKPQPEIGHSGEDIVVLLLLLLFIYLLTVVVFPAPGPPASLSFDSPSETSLILFWTPPAEPNGVLLGYVVQYQQGDPGQDTRHQMISDPSVTHMELDSLDSSSHYIFKVIARTAAGDGPPITRRGATLLDGVPPSNISINSGNTFFNLSWVPGERDRNHAHVFLGTDWSGGDWKHSEEVNSTQGFYILSGLKPGSRYRLMVAHGNVTLWTREAQTIGPVPWEVPGSFAAQGWLIGLISAIVLLILILLILCLIKRSKGGKYAVKDKEEKEVDSEARPMKDETFGEYRSKRSDSQGASLCGHSKLGSDDSLAEYGDSVDIQFNEDGSFIGQYSGRGPVAHGNESSGPASPDNAVPPPPIAPSMSSILNRPS